MEMQVRHPVPPRSTRILAGTGLLVALLAGGCSDPAGPGEVQPIDELPRALAPAEMELVRASNEFGVGLLKEVVADADGPNVALSPLSASMALEMTLNGAAGTTFDAMRGTLGFHELDQGEINASYRSLIDLLRGLDPTVDFRLANGVWAQEAYPFRPEFMDAVTTHFDAEVRNADFRSDATRRDINRWVAEATNGYIDPFVDALDPDLVMLLVNALYFEGLWETRFDPDRTTPQTFVRADGSEVQVPMMTLEDAEIRTYFGPGYVAGELPYGGGAWTMLVVVPQGDGTARELVADMGPGWWDDLAGRLGAPGTVPVSLPRFTLTFEEVLDPMLTALGMGEAFTGAADFSNLSTAERLRIDEVRQKVFIEVDEAGTRAAAATSVGIIPVSLPPSIRADRPFVFAIRERFSGAMLFSGVIGDPSRRD